MSVQLLTYTLSTLEGRQSRDLLVKCLISILARRRLVGVELILINVDKIETLNPSIPHTTCMPETLNSRPY